MITGFLQSESGNPIADAEIEFDMGQDKATLSGKATTGYNGNFSITISKVTAQMNFVGYGLGD